MVAPYWSHETKSKHHAVESRHFTLVKLTKDRKFNRLIHQRMKAILTK